MSRAECVVATGLDWIEIVCWLYSISCLTAWRWLDTTPARLFA